MAIIGGFKNDYRSESSRRERREYSARSFATGASLSIAADLPTGGQPRNLPDREGRATAQERRLFPDLQRRQPECAEQTHPLDTRPRVSDDRGRRKRGP